MANTKRTALTDEERAEHRRHEQELTQRAVAQLRCSAGSQRWLTVRAQLGLRRLSMRRNQLLVCLLKPARIGKRPAAQRPCSAAVTTS